MRHLTFFVAPLIVLVLAAVPATAAVKVFLLAGQSNMAGYSTGLPTTSPYNAPLPDVRFWNYGNNGWIDLKPGLGDTSNDIGPEVGFGHALNQIFPDDDIYLVKWGVDSTSLAVDWNPSGGTQYNTFKSRVNAALGSLAGQSPEVAGMIWMQGESDAANATYGAAYATNLASLIGTVRTSYSTPDMPFVVGRITDLSIYPGFPAVAAVRTAQETVPGTMSNVSWINTDDIPQGSAAGHYSATGQLILGTRFANKFTDNPIPEPIPDSDPDPLPIPSGTMGVQFDVSSGTLGANNNTVGWRFKAGQDITVTRLGCLNGVVTTDDTRAGVAHAVGIYSEATGQLLGSALVVNGAAGSTDQWLWTDLATPITLTAGNIYRIAANPNGDKWTYNTANHSVGPGVLIGTDLAPGVPLTDNPGSRVAAYEAGNKLQYPAQLLWDVEVIYDGIFGPNFKYEDAAVPGPRGVHGTGTHLTGVTAPALPANNLIVQGSSTFSHSFSGGTAPASWGAQLPDGINNGVMTPANDAAATILAWDGVTGNFGWAVYVLDTTTNSLGYDVSEILSYAGWTGARINQAVEIKYALVGDTITEGSELQHTLGSFSYSPSENTNGYDYSILSITNDDGPTVLSGISAIEVKYIDNLFNATSTVFGLGNYSAYKQFAVIGSATMMLGDANGDGVVDDEDASILGAHWMASGVGWGEGDFNGDHKVDDRDAAILAAHWSAGAGEEYVPEPSTLAGLLGLCLAGLSASARRRSRADAQTMSGNSGNAL